MKKSLLLWIIAWIATSTLSCANVSGGSGRTSSNIDRIQNRGAVIIGTAANTPPLNMTTRTGEIDGLDIDLAKRIAAAMGVKLRLVTKHFYSLVPALEAGEVDMIISAVTMTPERNLKVSFAGPYHVSGKSILTKKAAIAKINHAKQLDSYKYHLVAVRGSASEQLVRETMPRANLLTASTYDEAIDMVRTSEVDAMVSDYHTCLLATVRNPRAGFRTAKTPFTYEPLGIALPAGDAHLMNWTNNFLNTMKASGELERLKTKWLKNRSWIRQLY